MRTTAAIPVARRVSGFSYAIRNIVAEARKVEAAGRRVRYLNIGDPVTFGFQTPPHMIEAVERAMRDGHNGYVPSVGIASDGTLYFGWIEGTDDGLHAHVAVSHDKGLTWTNNRDIGSAQGLHNAVFIESVAGDPDREDRKARGLGQHRECARCQ